MKSKFQEETTRARSKILISTFLSVVIVYMNLTRKAVWRARDCPEIVFFLYSRLLDLF